MSTRRLTVALCFALAAACAKPDADADAPATPAGPPAPYDLNRVDQARQMGADSARIWFIMGSDFQCPYCKAFHDETWPRIEREYVRTGKIRVAFLNHPMSFHQRAIPAAEAAMCAGAQDRFWQMHDSLFANQEKWVGAADPHAVFESLARSLGLDLESWTGCMKSHATRTMIEADHKRTSDVGITGTPSFVIGDSLAVVGAAPYGDFKKALDDALARARR